MKGSILVVAIVVGLAAAASERIAAQAAPGADSPQARQAREQVSMMEGVLVRAVQNGVNNLRRRVREVMPDDALLQGGFPQVHGFRLDGYGVFFAVQVPGLRPSMAWTIQTMNDTGRRLASDLAQMRRYVQSVQDARMRTELERTLQRIQRGIGPVPPAAASQPEPGRVEAAALTAPGAPVAAAAAAAQDPAPLPDPSELYTEEVKTALVDAMIQYSGALSVGPNEWLTVAARDNEPTNPLTQSDPEVMTILLRIKGSDLTAHRAGRLTLEETRARVEVQEF
ncbi:MAG: hypothetical protein FJW14_02355 [Acidimicrobiia bacterium]|nr:hypothetical protein [Acidimicrobiia bacterium]